MGVDVLQRREGDAACGTTASVARSAEAAPPPPTAPRICDAPSGSEVSLTLKTLQDPILPWLPWSAFEVAAFQTWVPGSDLLGNIDGVV